MGLYFDAAKSVSGEAINVGLGGFFAGYVYGKLFKADIVLAEQAFGITALVGSIFHSVTYLATGGSKGDSPRLFHAIMALGQTVSLTAQIIAYRHFNLIAKRGTIIWGSLGLLATSVHVLRACGYIKEKAE